MTSETLKLFVVKAVVAVVNVVLVVVELLVLVVVFVVVVKLVFNFGFDFVNDPAFEGAILLSTLTDVFFFVAVASDK